MAESLAECRSTDLCINCLDCVPACPAKLLPHYLYHFALADLAEQLEIYRVVDCTACGACSEVCPTGLPLARRIAAARAQIQAAVAASPANPLPPTAAT